MKTSTLGVFPLLLTLALGLTFSSCKKDDSENETIEKLTTPALTLTEDSGTLTASWTAVENALEYELLAEKATTDGSFESLSTERTSETSFSYPDLLPNTLYRITLTAKGDATRWLDSDPVTKSYQTALKLDTPQPSVTEVTLGKASLSWEAVESAEGYAYKVLAEDGETVITIGSTQQTQVTIDHLMANSTYTFMINAVANADSAISETGEVEFTTDNMTFDIEISEITYNRARFEVTPSTDKYSYFSGILTDSSVASLSDAEIVAWLEEQKNNNDAILGRDVVYGKEVTRYVIGLAPESEYFIVAFGYDYDETTQTGYATTPVTKASFTTAEEPEASSKYTAWLGTWQVTSTSSQVTGQKLSFNIEISKKAVNSTYYITGWGITEHGAKQQLEMRLNDMTGMTHITTCQQGENYELDGSECGTYTVAFIEGGQFITGGAGSDIFEGQMFGNTNAILNAYPIFVDGENYYPTGFDFMAFTSDGRWVDLPVREGFTDRDYPTGRFILTRISETTSSVPQKVTPHVIKAKAASAAPVVPTGVRIFKR